MIPLALSLDGRVARAVAFAWDESAHPRHPKGESEGGEFASTLTEGDEKNMWQWFEPSGNSGYSKQFTESIDATLDKLPKFSGTAWRGLELYGDQSVQGMADLRPGATFSWTKDERFTRFPGGNVPFSKSRDIAESFTNYIGESGTKKVLIEASLKTAADAHRYAERVKAYVAPQQEVVSRGTSRFVIKSVSESNGVTHVKVEEI